MKTLADPQGVEVSQHSPTAATVTDLTSRPAPTRKQLTDALTTRFPEERLVYELQARVIGYKLEADSDFHIVLAEIAQPMRTMIAEIPSGKCAKGPQSQLFSTLQAKFTSDFGKPTAKFKKLTSQQCIRARGVGFFDFLHGQTGVAKNAFELHPLLSWDVVSCYPAASGNTALNAYDRLPEPRWIQGDEYGYWSCPAGYKEPEVKHAGWRCEPIPGG